MLILEDTADVLALLKSAKYAKAFLDETVGLYGDYNPDENGLIIIAELSDEDAIRALPFESVKFHDNMYFIRVVTSNDSCNTYIVAASLPWSIPFRLFLDTSVCN